MSCKDIWTTAGYIKTKSVNFFFARFNSHLRKDSWMKLSLWTFFITHCWCCCFSGWPRIHFSWVSPPLSPPRKCWPISNHLHPVNWWSADSDRAKGHRGEWIRPQRAQHPRHPWRQAQRCCLLLEAERCWKAPGPPTARIDRDGWPQNLYPPPFGFFLLSLSLRGYLCPPHFTFSSVVSS